MQALARRVQLYSLTRAHKLPLGTVLDPGRRRLLHCQGNRYHPGSLALLGKVKMDGSTAWSRQKQGISCWSCKRYLCRSKYCFEGSNLLGLLLYFGRSSKAFLLLAQATSNCLLFFRSKLFLSWAMILAAAACLRVLASVVLVEGLEGSPVRVRRQVGGAYIADP
jgi:hypothetical protein